jgi:hypothetical protein
MERTISATPGAPDPGNVIAWRGRCLEQAGFPRAAARALAQDRGVDVHAVLDVVERGCPVELAARIFAPLDDPGAAR